MSDTIRVITFQDALKETEGAQRNLLLGNGFSIACEPDIFNYSSLYAHAAEKIKKEMPEVHSIFESLGTKDFEIVVQMLNHADATLPHYLPTETSARKRIQEHSENLKGMLVTTIAEHHPDFPARIPDWKLAACRKFLVNFIPEAAKGNVYTLNYDLLLYWVLMHSESDEAFPTSIGANDGFGKDTPGADYVVWMNEDHTKGQRAFYLHGAIHLFDTGTQLEKYTWINKGKPLIQQAREALGRGSFPLFVAEGNHTQKLEKIRRHPYLHHCLKSFAIAATREGHAGSKPLFIFGHSMADNDDHILQHISEGSIARLYVSIYGDPNTPRNQAIIRKAELLKTKRDWRKPLSVNYFSAESANVWGDA